MKKKILIVAASLLLLGAVGVKPAMAYFTATHESSGVASFGHIEITPHEKIDGFTKSITIENTGDNPVYVRVQLFAGSTHKLTVAAGSSSKWDKDADGFYYYSDKLEAGATTETLSVTVDSNGETAKEFNVIVVSEATGVKADGSHSWTDVSQSNKDLFNGKGGVN